MNKLNFINKKNGEILDSREWNLLVSFLNALIDFYNEFPDAVSSFDNDLGYLTLLDIAEYATKGDVASAIQALIDSGGVTGPQGEAGLTPYIDTVTKHWKIGDVDTGIVAEGQNGSNGITPYIDPNTKHWVVGNVDTGILAEGVQGPQGELGIQGIQGPQGEGFSIFKEYASVTVMNADKDNVPVGKFVIINSNVEDPDNSKLYTRTDNTTDYPTGFKFLTDLSGAQGILGPQGIQGIQGIQGETGPAGTTPHIDATTGNWFIGTTNTGVHAQGPQGPSVQSDWNQSDNTLLDYIKNKPQVYTKSEIDSKFINHDFVEIAGIKWATKNIGADEITDKGLYFLWGDIEGYTEDLIGNDDNEKYFDYSDYKYGNGIDQNEAMIVTKYNSSDHLSTLENIDDAARINKGFSWRIPTESEFRALIKATKAVWTDDYKGSGAYGVILTDKTDNSKELFFHEVFAASEGSNMGYIAGYWTSTLQNNYMQEAKILEISHIYSLVSIGQAHRELGLPIRAVLDEPKVSKVTYTGNYEDLNNKPDVYTKNETDTKILSSKNPEYIEIGGIKWATKNLGAINITDIGLFFLWADTLGYTEELIINGEKDFDRSTDKYYNNNSYTKYNTTDKKIILEKTDDPAKSIWGKNWKTPTLKHFQILLSSTTNTWVTNYQGSGINGRLFTDTLDSSKTLFFPYGKSSGALYGCGDYWTSNNDSTLGEDYSYEFRFSNNSCVTDYEYRFFGNLVRAVIDESESEINNTKEYIVNRLLSTNYEYVDLGLPSGTLWAKCNVGASTETDYGNYYKYGTGVLQFIYDSADPPHYTGNINPLPASVDTATLVMGKMWHMPTYTQVNELYQYTFQGETSINGVSGVICYGLNGNYVFFPYSGGYSYSYSSGTNGNFWTSSLDTNNDPYYISLINKCIQISSMPSRYVGFSVRGVIDKESILAFSGDYNDLTNKPNIVTSSTSGLKIEVVSAMPASPDANTIYIVL